MKQSNIKLTWNVGFTLRIPTSAAKSPALARRLPTGVCLLSLALGALPPLALLAG